VASAAVDVVGKAWQGRRPIYTPSRRGGGAGRDYAEFA
jgi:hypothetical protein